MTPLIGAKHIEFGSVNDYSLSSACHFGKIKLGKSSGHFSSYIAPAPDNETQTGLVVKKPFPSHWEHILDTHTPVVLSCMLLSVLAAEWWGPVPRVHRDHWNRWGWRKLVWVQWGDLGLVTSQAVYCRDAGKM